MSRRAALAVAAVAVVAAFTVGSGALSVATVDRHVAVGVAGPAGGYLGVEPPAGSPAAGDATVLLGVTNRFSVPVTATVAVRVDPVGPPVVRNATDPGRLTPGETARVTAAVRCDDTADRDRVTVVVAAAGNGVEVRMSRRVEVVCAGGDTPTERSRSSPAG